MEERKEIVNKYIYKGMKAEKAARIAGFSRSSYYYKPTGNKPGKRPSTITLKKNGDKVDNDKVVSDIKNIIKPDFIDYGYDKVTAQLKKMSYIINRKKVYRLMKENHLLNPKKMSRKLSKNYVKFSQPYPSQPFEVLEIDIKYIYIAGDKRNAFLITIIDVFTRKALVWNLDYSMKSHIVISLIDKLILKYLQPRDLLNKNIKVTIRSDNGSQFIAKLVRNHLKENLIYHEFIKPATPQQNAYIESFHSIVEKLVCKKFEFENLNHAIDVFANFFNTYNKKRIMKCLLYKSPDNFLDEWDNGNLMVAYNIFNKKQSFFFREKQNQKSLISPLP